MKSNLTTKTPRHQEKLFKRKISLMTNTGSLHIANGQVLGLQQSPKTRKPESSYPRNGSITIFPKLQVTRPYQYKPLPPLIELNDSEKFRDDQDNVHEVEVRGKKTKEDIRFKCKDVGRVFEIVADIIGINAQMS